MIRHVTAGDAEPVAAIYNPYVLDTVITFEERPVPAREMEARIEEVAAASLPWLVAEEDGRVVGYAYASRWKGRSAYRFTTESTVYLDPRVARRGWGTRLYRALLSELRERRLHSVIGGIALPNAASVALHEKLGFTKVAHFSEVGFKFGQWIDVGYWQRAL